MPPPTIKLDHVPDEHLRGVGLVAIAFAFLEGAVERIIWRMGRLNDRQGACITTHMTIIARTDTALTLVNDEFPDTEPAKRLKLASNSIKNTLGPLRNEIAHSRLISFDNSGPVLRSVYRARGSLKKGVKLIELEDYENAAEQILEGANELRDILWHLNKLITRKDGTPPP